MNPHEQDQIENLALAAELSRQLCHDFSNFVYNLFLQIEIASAAPESSDWEGLKQESRRMTRRLQEWDQFHSRFSFEETKIDLHESIRQMASGLQYRGRTVQLAAPILNEHLWIGGAAIDSRHLLRLLAEDIFHTWDEAAGTIPAVSIQSQNAGKKICITILAQEASENAGPSAWDQAAAEDLGTSLLTATCRSLAVRLGATIQRERASDGRYIVQVEFPISLMDASS